MSEDKKEDQIELDLEDEQEVEVSTGGCLAPRTGRRQHRHLGPRPRQPTAAPAGPFREQMACRHDLLPKARLRRAVPASCL